MKIWMIGRGIPTHKNPMHGIFECDQAKALKNAGHDIVFLTVDLRSLRRWRRWGIYYTEIDNLPVVSINIPCGAISRGLYEKIGIWAFNRLYRKAEKKFGKPDVIHAHFWDIACFCTSIIGKENIKYVITEHSSLILNEPIEKSVYKMAKKAYNSANTVIAVSNTLRQRILKHYDINPKVVCNMLDEKSFPLERSLIQKQSKEAFVFVSCGNLVHGKGFDLLLEAFSRMDIPAKLIIFGDGPLRKELEKKSFDLHVDERVVFMGRCERSLIREVYLESDCFVLPSRYETFGVVYIEALACGLPVIATRCGGPEDIVNDNIGLLIEKENIDELSKALDFMYLHRDKFSSLECVDYIKKNYSQDAIVLELEKVYSEI